MKYNMKCIIICLIMIVLFLCIEIYYKPDIDYHVITLKTKSRMDNIELQQKKLNKKINIFDAINGNMFDDDVQINLNKNNILAENFMNFSKKRNKEIACFQSHLSCLKSIDIKKSYTIIFEDDVVINDNFENNINHIIDTIENNKIEFDIIFLSNTFSNIGTKLLNNIYNIDKTKFTIGMYGYLIHNKNVKKIINLLSLIDAPIDNKIDSLIKYNNIIAYTIHPEIVRYRVDIKSDILD